jgi:putative tricarboxylic transport membrane protein
MNRKTKQKWLQRATVMGFLLPAAAGAAFAADWKPTKSIEFVVPSGAGGGTDQFARLVQSIVIKHKLTDQSIVVVNKAGGSGAEAFLDASLAKGDAHKVVFGTNNAYLLPLVVKLPYKFEQLTPVAMLAQDEFLLWIPQDAPFNSAKEYLDAVKKSPADYRMGGAQSKDTDQTLVELINKTAGVKFAYVPFKSGAEAATQLAGKHIGSNVNNPNENISQWRAGQVRPLCVFSSERMKHQEKVTATKAWSDVPTCKESGLKIEEYRMPRAVYMPTGLKQEQVNFYVDLLKKVSETAEWKAFVQTNALNPSFASGEEMKKYIAKDEATARQIFQESGWLIK